MSTPNYIRLIGLDKLASESPTQGEYYTKVNAIRNEAMDHWGLSKEEFSVYAVAAWGSRTKDFPVEA